MDFDRMKGGGLDAGARPNMSEAMRSGSLRTKLEALRDYLAARLDEDPHPRDAAPLAQRLTDVLTQLDALPDTGVASDVDDLAAQRARRLAGRADAAS